MLIPGSISSLRTHGRHWAIANIVLEQRCAGKLPSIDVRIVRPPTLPRPHSLKSTAAALARSPDITVETYYYGH